MLGGLIDCDYALEHVRRIAKLLQAADVLPLGGTQRLSLALVGEEAVKRTPRIAVPKDLDSAEGAREAVVTIEDEPVQRLGHARGIGG